VHLTKAHCVLKHHAKHKFQIIVVQFFNIILVYFTPLLDSYNVA